MSISEFDDWEIRPSAGGGAGKVVASQGRNYSTHMYQRVIVKAEYIETGQKPAALAKLQKYLERDGNCRETFLSVERGARYLTRDGERLFGSAAELDGWNGEGRFWHVIVSPEASWRVSTGELRRFTGRLVARWEREIGHQLEYRAAIHAESPRASNREPQPHIHLLIRGTTIIDGRRQLFRIPRRTISHTFRGNARELATRMWGMRTMQDREKSWQDQIEARRPTRLDLRIREKAPAGVVVRDRLDRFEQARADFLVREGHARIDLLGRLRLEDGYADRLDRVRHAQDRMRQRAEEVPER